MKTITPSTELLWVTDYPELEIELAGRTCYKSEGLIKEGSAAKLVTKFLESGHHAMLEHACASFRIITDRGITHEIVRHRLASYAQESTRYCNYSGDKFGHEISVIEPPGLNGRAKDKFRDACLEAEKNYFDMLDCGCSAQIARSVLPTCTKTEIIMTANLREFRHFIKLRASEKAHPQIRPIAIKMLRILTGLAPNVFNDLYEEFIVNGE